MYMKKMNKKGFTLVELLAVIVVLAIIMVIAVPSVLNSMNAARQSSFLVYAEKMINSAQAKYQSDSLVNTMPQEYCYNLSELTDNESSQYKGFVHIQGAATSKPTYKVIMFDSTYSVGIVTDTTIGDKAGGLTFSDIETIKTKLGDNSLYDGGDYEVSSPCGSDTTKTKGAVSITGEKSTSGLTARTTAAN